MRLIDAHLLSGYSMRMLYGYDLSAPRKATNLTVNSDLLSQAKALGINLSQLLEQSLTQEVKKRKAELWLRENQAAIQNYNQDVLDLGLFSDDLRSF